MSGVILPWPPKELSPNARLHWSKVAKAKKSYRQISWALALEAKIKVSTTGEEPIFLRVSFFPPDRRHRDDDNMIASMKAGLDGLADALKVNDRRFKCTWEFSTEIKGQVKVELI